MRPAKPRSDCVCLQNYLPTKLQMSLNKVSECASDLVTAARHDKIRPSQRASDPNCVPVKQPHFLTSQSKVPLASITVCETM